MKKQLAVISLLALSLLAANTVMANPEKSETHKSASGSQHKKTGLEFALDHVKNPKARAAIQRAIERQKQREKEDQEEKEKRDKKEKHPTVKTDQQRVDADKAALSIIFGGSDSATSVTQPLKLKTTGKFGSTITWTSSNPAVISNDGKTIVRPLNGDVNVVLTATITRNNVSAVKQFAVIVKTQLSDAQTVAADKAALAVGFSGSDNANFVTSPLLLPSTGANGSIITWTSTAPAIISNNGKTVNRPAAGQGNAAVTLIANISSNGISDVKLFALIVKQQLSDADKVAADKAALAIGFSGSDNANFVTSPLLLPSAGANGSTITWLSSAPAIISNNGKTVNRPAAGQGDVTVTLNAVIKSNTATDLKSFTLVVKQQLTDAQKVAADKAALIIGFSGTDTAANVTSNLTLPTVGVNGSIIVWYSSNTAIVSDNGTVIRPSAGTGDNTVTLTAIIIDNATLDTKAFTVTVKQLP